MATKQKAEPASGVTFRPAVHLPLIFGGMAFIFLTVGLWLLMSDSAEREYARGSALEVADANTLRWREPGQSVLVEGRLATSNRTGFQNFIAYQRDRYAGKDSDGPNKDVERWTSIELVTPPLTLETNGGNVAVINSRYTLRNSPQRWRGLTPQSLFGANTERVNGFLAGDLVVVEGKVTEAATSSDGKPTRAVEAAVLFGGNHAAYLANLKGGIVAAKIIGGVFTGVGLLLVFVAWIIRTKLSKRT